MGVFIIFFISLPARVFEKKLPVTANIVDHLHKFHGRQNILYEHLNMHTIKRKNRAKKKLLF